MALIGFQLANAVGENIQGDPSDPLDLASFHVLSPKLAVAVIEWLPECLLWPIFDGDIEEPELISGDWWEQSLILRAKGS